MGFALTWIDFAVIAAYFLLNIGIGLAYRSRASKSIDDYFVSGRSVPWWLAGTSMVATTFAADTPLAVTGMVARNGIAGNWLWWNFVFSGMMTVFLFARLWRRSGVLTDVEFAEIRYSGKPAAILRGFRAIYLGVPINCMVLGWVNLAMVKILVLLFGIGKEEAILVIFGIIGVTAFISTLSGLWGVLVTDLVQFVIKMGMTIVLAVYAVNAVGGISPLKEKLLAVDAARGILAGSTDSVLSFIPDLHSTWMPFIAFFAYLAVNWWASWYPGAEPGGGGYIAQRMLSAKDEKHSLLATLWFNIAHYAIRPWPWILIGLTTLILYPGLEDPETGYVKVMIEHLPPYLRGLMIASFLAAYMSTVSTQLNWGASYIVNDFYRRFLRPSESDKHYVFISQASTVLLTILAAAVTYVIDSISGAYQLLMAIGAGTGGVLLLRWYWWRINAWSEISAMVASLLVSVFLQLYLGWNSQTPDGFAYVLFWTVGITTVVWVSTTYLTSPEPDSILVSFYRRVRPEKLGWQRIAALAPEVKPKNDLGANLMDWAAGCALIFFALFGVGKVLLQEYALGSLLIAGAVAAAAFIYWDFNRRGWSTAVE
ncbi:MAG: Na+:solute symporter [Bryobacterales bacterium]|nr:Na+:solute symporter [Bryobacterales bacterium]